MSDSNGKPKTLSERLAAALEKLRQKVAKEQDDSFRISGYFPTSDKNNCSICGAPRLDQDITGMTCGSPSCVMAFIEEKKDYQELDAEIRKIANAYCDVSSTDDAKNLLEKIHEAFDLTDDSLSDLTTLIEDELAPLLNVDIERKYLDENKQMKRKKIEPKEILEAVIAQIRDLIKVVEGSEAEEEPA